MTKMNLLLINWPNTIMQTQYIYAMIIYKCVINTKIIRTKVKKYLYLRLVVFSFWYVPWFFGEHFYNLSGREFLFRAFLKYIPDRLLPRGAPPCPISSGVGWKLSYFRIHINMLKLTIHSKWVIEQSNVELYESWTCIPNELCSVFGSKLHNQFGPSYGIFFN